MTPTSDATSDQRLRNGLIRLLPIHVPKHSSSRHPFVVPVIPLGPLAAAVAMISVLGDYVKLRKRES